MLPTEESFEIVDVDPETDPASRRTRGTQLALMGLGLVLAGALVSREMMSPTTQAPPTTSFEALRPTVASRELSQLVGFPSAREIALSKAIEDWMDSRTRDALETRDGWNVDWYPDSIFLQTEAMSSEVVVTLDARIPAPNCSVGTVATASELAQWIANNPDLRASGLELVPVSGITVIQLDVSVSPTAQISSCGPDRRFPVVEVYDEEHHHPRVVMRDQVMRAYFFNLFDGSPEPRTVAVLITSDEDELDREVGQTMPIITSLLSALAPLK